MRGSNSYTRSPSEGQLNGQNELQATMMSIPAFTPIYVPSGKKVCFRNHYCFRLSGQSRDKSSLTLSEIVSLRLPLCFWRLTSIQRAELGALTAKPHKPTNESRVWKPESCSTISLLSNFQLSFNGRASFEPHEYTTKP